MPFRSVIQNAPVNELRKRHLYPPIDNLLYKSVPIDLETIWTPIEILAELRSQPQSNLAIATTVNALQPYLPSVKVFKNHSLYLTRSCLILSSRFCKARSHFAKFLSMAIAYSSISNKKCDRFHLQGVEYCLVDIFDGAMCPIT